MRQFLISYDSTNPRPIAAGNLYVCQFCGGVWLLGMPTSAGPWCCSRQMRMRHKPRRVGTAAGEIRASKARAHEELVTPTPGARREPQRGEHASDVDDGDYIAARFEEREYIDLTEYGRSVKPS